MAQNNERKVMATMILSVKLMAKRGKKAIQMVMVLMVISICKIWHLCNYVRRSLSVRTKILVVFITVILRIMPSPYFEQSNTAKKASLEATISTATLHRLDGKRFMRNFRMMSLVRKCRRKVVYMVMTLTATPKINAGVLRNDNARSTVMQRLTNWDLSNPRKEVLMR